jgi:hypothetical protein
LTRDTVLDQQIDIVAKRVARYECLVKSVGLAGLLAHVGDVIA